MKSEPQKPPTVAELAKAHGVTRAVIRKWIHENDPRVECVTQRIENVFAALEKESR